MGKNYLKEAEKNLVNQAVAFRDMLNVIEALGNFGNRACKEHIGRPDFLEGLTMMRRAIYAEYAHTTSELLMFAGVGGKDALAFARQKFEDLFGTDKYFIAHFLTKWGQPPGWVKTEDEEGLRAEAKERIRQ